MARPLPKPPFSSPASQTRPPPSPKPSENTGYRKRPALLPGYSFPRRPLPRPQRPWPGKFGNPAPHGDQHAETGKFPQRRHANQKAQSSLGPCLSAQSSYHLIFTCDCPGASPGIGTPAVRCSGGYSISGAGVKLGTSSAFFLPRAFPLLTRRESQVI
jgi:hypothetical protein